MQKRIFLILSMLGIFLSQNLAAQRISGYFPNYAYTAANYLNVQYGKMTHLYYFALNPAPLGGNNNQSDGTLWYDDIYSWFTTTRFNNVVNQARTVNPNIKILIVTGGAPGSDGGLNARLNYIASNASRLNRFCNNICTFIKNNNLDGWDLDWEFPSTTTDKNNHEAMLARMRQKIDSMKTADCKHYEIHIAVGGGYTDRLPKACWNPAHTDYLNANALNHVDIVNIMTYDGNIGAAPCSFASHQHYDLMVKALGDWLWNFPALPTSKIQLGVGFYNNSHTAFSSGGNNSTWYNQTYWPTGGSGCPNMQSKINYARTQNTAGTFIWEILQDNLCSGTTPTCYSLLDCMYQYTISTWGVWTPPSVCTAPVVLVNFSGKWNNGTVTLSWQSASEINHKFYVVQSSDDAREFKDVEYISGTGRNGAGSNYMYLHSNPALYYRLAMVDVNGGIEYSRIISSGSHIPDYPPFPNPFTSVINLNIPAGEEQVFVKVYDLAGMEIFNGKVGAETSSIQLGEDWKEGIYILKIITESQERRYKVRKL